MRLGVIQSEFCRRYFHPAAEHVGLAPLRPHDLRHSAVFPDYDDCTTRHLENLWDEAKTDNVVPIKDRRARLSDHIARTKIFRFPIVLTDHVFDKIRSIDLTLAEFREALQIGLVIEETVIAETALKQLVLAVDWLRPLHVVVVDEAHREERIVQCTNPTRLVGAPTSEGGDHEMRRM